jgi:hypothetical protein
VVEFANINSYLNLFRKEGGVNKYIDFGEAGRQTRRMYFGT